MSNPQQPTEFRTQAIAATEESRESTPVDGPSTESAGSVMVRLTLQMAAASLRTLFFRCLTLMLVAVALSIAVYFIVRSNDSWDGLIGAAAAFLVNAVVAVVLAVKSAAFTTALAAIEQSPLGETIFESLLSGFTGEKQRSSTLSPTPVDAGLTEPELKALLEKRSAALVNRASMRVPWPLRWLARRVLGVITWGASKAALHYAGEADPNGTRRVTTQAISSALAPRIVRQMTADVRQQVGSSVRFVMKLAAAVTIVAALAYRLFTT